MLKRVVGLFVLFCFSFLSANELKIDKIKLQLQWKHQFEFAGFYVAKEKGYYQNVGLDVEFLEYNSNQDISEIILNDDAQYGLKTI